MTDKELIEVSNRAWDAFVNQMPEELTGYDLLKIIIRFVVNSANALDIKPTTVCMMMYYRLSDERHKGVNIVEQYKVINSDEQYKVVNSIEGALLFASIVALMIGSSCMLWFNYKLGTKIFDVGCICILAYWTLKFVVKVIGFVYLWRIRK